LSGSDIFLSGALCLIGTGFKEQIQ
jgi:hypothetical protein